MYSKRRTFQNVYVGPNLISIRDKDPPIFVFLSAGISFGVTPKSVGFHRFSPTKIGEKIGRFFCSGKVGRFFCRWGNRLVGHKLKLSTRTAPISINRCLQVCITCRLIFIQWCSILFIFVVSWNPRFTV